jgi:hypothetical protein
MPTDRLALPVPSAFQIASCKKIRDATVDDDAALVLDDRIRVKLDLRCIPRIWRH